MISARVFVPVLAAGWLAGATAIPSAFAASTDPAGEATAESEPPLRVPFTLSLDLQTVWRRDAAYQMFSREDTDEATGLSLTYDLAHLGQRGTLAVGAGWLGESSSGQWAQQNSAELKVNTFLVTAAARWAWRPWLEPYVRVAVGGARGQVALGFNDGTPTMTARAWSASVSAGAGFRLRTRASRSRLLPAHAFSVAVEGGFTAGTPLSLSAHPAKPANAEEAKDQLPGAATDLGKLGRSQPYASLSLGLHF